MKPSDGVPRDKCQVSGAGCQVVYHDPFHPTCRILTRDKIGLRAKAFVESGLPAEAEAIIVALEIIYLRLSLLKKGVS